MLRSRNYAHIRGWPSFFGGSQNARRSFYQKPQAGVENGKINICFASVKRRYYLGAKVNETLIQHRD
jgi:hypothetical protein